MKKQIQGIVSWDGYFYGYKEFKNKIKYFKSNNASFDYAEECDENEYNMSAKKYADIMR